MTVSSEDSRKTFAGNGVTTSFSTSPMVFFDAADLTVYVVTTATGVVVATLVLNTDYTVSGGSGSTGTLDLSAGSSPYGAPATGTTLVIVRDVAATQSSDLVNNDGSDAEVLEDALDRLTMIAQQLETSIGRSFKLADSDVSGASTAIPTPVASRLIGWNDAGTALTNYSASALSTALTTAFTLTMLDDADADAVFQTLVSGATAITSPAAGDIMLLSDVSETPDDGRSITLGNMLKVINDLTAGTELDGTNDKIVVYDNSASAVRAIPAGVPFRKNAIINGSLNVWQLGTSFTSVAHNTVTADRWKYLKTGDMVHDVSRSTDVPTVAEAGRLFNYSLLVDCTTVDAAIAAGDFLVIAQTVEGYNWLPLSQRAFTLSFWVKATKTGTYCVSFVNSGDDRSYVAEYTVNVTDTWEKKTINVSASPSAGTWDYTNGTGIGVRFALAAGSTFQTTAGSWATGNYLATANQVNGADSTSNNFRLAAVQIEPGSVATDFEYRTFQDELALCQRYVCVPTSGGSAVAQSATAIDGWLQTPVPMRTTPSISFSGTLTFTAPGVAAYNTTNALTVTSYDTSTGNLVFNGTGFSAMTAQQNGFISTYGTTVISAEF